MRRRNQCTDFHEVCFISKLNKCITKLYVKFLIFFGLIWVLFSSEKKNVGHFFIFSFSFGNDNENKKSGRIVLLGMMQTMFNQNESSWLKNKGPAYNFKKLKKYQKLKLLHKYRKFQNFVMNDNVIKLNFNYTYQISMSCLQH